MDYLVNLDVFRGPLDLLLYLVKRDEVDIRDIPIARVTRQFQEYLDLLAIIDVERAGDFLVMAATLMEIKSKLLLPRPEENGTLDEDPRSELVRQLLEYKQFKEATAVLDSRADEQALRLPRTPLPGAASAQTATLQPVELWDLVSAFGRLMRETLANQPVQVVIDQTPVHVHMEEVLRRLREDGSAPLSALFTPPFSRSRLVGLFLAILELIRRDRVIAEQPGQFDDIWLTLAPGDDGTAPAAEEMDAPEREGVGDSVPV
jgi:segregation and condensation protein A